ncbi:MFS transporter [Actinomadura vinacea]
MDNTVVANALPTMIRELGMSNSAKDWVATGYILMFSCLMIAGGRLTDVYGCRVTFTTGMAVFTTASAVCGLAPDDMVLILARIVQGAGAALALPASLVMVTVGRTDKQRSVGTIVWVGAASAATALGPAIGGLIVSHWHWGWIFLINIPAGILVIALGTAVLTAEAPNTSARVDLPGVLISATMVFALAYGLESGRKHGWTDPSVLSVFALAAIALPCFVVVEAWAPDPMMNLRFFRNRVFVGGLLSQMLWGIGFNGMVFYSATFLQTYLGFSPPKAGLVMFPSAIAVLVMTPVAFWLAARAGPRTAIGGGMAAMAFGMVLFSMLRRDDGFADLMPGVLVVGIGAAMCMPLAMYVLKAVPDEQAGLAGGILNVIREVSGAFGIAIIGLLIHEVPRQDASAAELEAFRQGTASGLIIGAALVLIGGVISAMTLPARRPPTAPEGTAGAPQPAAPEPAPPAPHHTDLLGSFRNPWEGLAVTTSGPAYTGPPRYPAYPADSPPPADQPSRETRSEPPTVKHTLAPHEEGRSDDSAWHPPPPPKGWYQPYVPEDSH